MKVRRQKQESLLVIWVVSGLMLLGMSVLVSELWQLQVPRKRGFEEVFHNQSVRRVRLPAVRGKIYDTHEVCLADSVPNYCIAIYTEELRAPRSPVANTLELLHEVWARVGRPPDISYRDVQQHILLTSDEPLVAWKNLDDPSLARWRRRFEDWTAPEKGSRRRRAVAGLDLGKPVQGRSIVLQTSELKKRGTTTAANTLELVYKISERIGQPRAVTFQNIKDHIFARRPLPLLAWNHIDDKMMARWADSCSGLAGTDIFCMSDRYYPEGENLAHLIGFTRSADPIQEMGEGELADFDMRGIEGKKGLENLYNNLLEGEAGSRLVQIDVSGYHYRDLQTHLSQPGGDLQLTIDVNIQQFAKEALTMHLDTDPFKGEVKGAVVVLDPNNGDVLAMVSSPLFDPNRFMASSAYISQLRKNKKAPTFNRAVYGRYAPGSIFKPISALGVLRAHPEYADVHHDCPGYHMVGKRKMRCHAIHGEHLSLRQALEHSCNVFMFKMGLEHGYQPIYEMARDFGLGQVVGLFPDVEDFSGAVMTKGDTYGNLPEKAIGKAGLCNLSIGQGDLIVAPLQMAMVVATIANGGHLYRPRLIKKFKLAPDKPYQTNPTTKIRYIPIPTEALELVRGGMHDVIMSGNEAAKIVRVGDIVMAGKTGTAEYGPKELGKKNTWMISYAPFDAPRYAIAFIVEDGVYGGTTVAPRLHELYQKIFEYDGTLKQVAGSGEQGVSASHALLARNLHAPCSTPHAILHLQGGEE